MTVIFIVSTISPALNNHEVDGCSSIKNFSVFKCLPQTNIDLSVAVTGLNTKSGNAAGHVII